MNGRLSKIRSVHTYVWSKVDSRFCGAVYYLQTTSYLLRAEGYCQHDYLTIIDQIEDFVLFVIQFDAEKALIFQAYRYFYLWPGTKAFFESASTRRLLFW